MEPANDVRCIDEQRWWRVIAVESTGPTGFANTEWGQLQVLAFGDALQSSYKRMSISPDHLNQLPAYSMSRPRRRPCLTSTWDSVGLLAQSNQQRHHGDSQHPVACRQV